MVCVSTSVSYSSKLGSTVSAILYVGQFLRWTEVESCTSLLCVVNVSTANVTLDTTQCRGVERECRVLDRPR
jgi:hypothetical protein